MTMISEKSDKEDMINYHILLHNVRGFQKMISSAFVSFPYKLINASEIEC